MRAEMRTDLVIDGMGCPATAVVELAIAAEAAGIDGVWVIDHFSGAVLDQLWSQDPFVLLGAVAAATERVSLGPLVADVLNRHPVQLASAIGSLQSLAPGRVLCGVGAGAGPGDRFAVEQVAVGRELLDARTRRQLVVDAIGALRAVWRGEPAYVGVHTGFEGLSAVVPPDQTCPPIVVGANGPRMAELAVRHADGVNLKVGPALEEQVALVHRLRRELDELGPTGPFEISAFDWVDEDHPTGGDVDRLARLGITRRTLQLPATTDPALLARWSTRR